MSLERGVFEIKQNPSGGYYFVLKDMGQETAAISGNYFQRGEMEKQIAKIREVAAVADIIYGMSDAITGPAFLITENGEGALFYLYGFDKEIIFSSGMYAEESTCRSIINKIRELSQNAKVVDLTE